MSVANILKRIWFEILFIVLCPILMVYHMTLVYALATWECFKVYPREIHNLLIRLVYGKEDS